MTTLSQTPPQIIHGDWSKKITSSDLAEERLHCDFNQTELTNILHGGEDIVKTMKEDIAIMENDEKLINTHKFYEMDREEQMAHSYKRTRHYFEKYGKRYFEKYSPSYLAWWTFMYQGLVSLLNSNMMIVPIGSQYDYVSTSC